MPGRVTRQNVYLTDVIHVQTSRNGRKLCQNIVKRNAFEDAQEKELS